ncbi:AMP-dependent synthetase [Candidatus Bathyarchaeota archaeon]|nr:MAG: AMP-dependent synthetase [Candidatus Bathyarchaeota archaeon]
MVDIPQEYLPPKEYMPDNFYALPELHYPLKLNLGKILLDDNAEKRGDKVAILFKDKRITYKQLKERVNKLANALKSLGVEDNDRVMIRMPNRPEWIESNFACWKIGAIPVLTNHLLRAETISYIANDSEAKVMIVGSEWLKDVEEAKPKMNFLKEIVVVGEEVKKEYHSYEEIIKDQSTDFPTFDFSRDHFGRLIYTSGTTGLPKGVLKTYREILSGADTHGRYILELSEKDVIGGHPYFSFAFGSVNFTQYPWRFGASLSIIERFTPEDMFKTIEDHKITVLCCVPTAFRMMLTVKDAEKKYDLSSLRICQSAGEWLPPSTIIEWKKRFGVEIIDSLGSSELNYWISTRKGNPENKIGSTGLPVPGYELKIVDEEWKEVPRGTPGYLIIRGPVGNTYWRKPEKQMKAVKDGWSLTDLMFIQDEDGYFWYQSRVDDMVVSAGHKIPGGEVENVLNEHPAVLESAVIAAPDPVRGNIVKAFVVLKPGYSPSEELVKELQNYVKERIEPWKYPRKIEFAKAEDLPRTVTGKIQRAALREMERKKYEEEMKKAGAT